MIGEKFSFLSDLPSQIQEVPEQGIISKTLVNNDDIKAVLFGMAPGQELSEHSAQSPVLIYFQTGEVDFFVDGKRITAQPCSWMHLTAGLTHSVVAKTTAYFLLVILKGK